MRGRASRQQQSCALVDGALVGDTRRKPMVRAVSVQRCGGEVGTQVDERGGQHDDYLVQALMAGRMGLRRFPRHDERASADARVRAGACPGARRRALRRALPVFCPVGAICVLILNSPCARAHRL
eukprot:6188162-Pleurochrysis_carterae.AAC.1